VPIKYGTYCPLHRNAASANRSNQQKRVPEHERKLGLAAQWWNRWPKRMIDKGEQAEWIAAKVKRGLDSNSTEIKRNWVTRNRAAIEKRDDATSEASQANRIDKTVGEAIPAKRR
jgi:hypothetical protein